MLLMIHYRANGESGRCGHGCCSPDRAWDSDLVCDEAATLAQAIPLCVDFVRARENYPEYHTDYKHYLVRPATTEEQAQGWSDDGTLYADGVHIAIHELPEYVPLLQAKRDEAEAAGKAKAARYAEAQAAARAEQVARDERAIYEKLKVKYEGGGEKPAS